MTTNTAGSVARQDPRQVSNTIRGSITFSQQAVFVPIGTLPKNAWVSLVQMSIDTAFNAGTTNPIVVGSSGTPNSLMQSGDNTPGTPGMYASPIARLGKALAAAADIVIGITYTPTGTAASTGAAEVLIEFEGGLAG
jgi:hypothetical protein